MAALAAQVVKRIANVMSARLVIRFFLSLLAGGKQRTECRLVQWSIGKLPAEHKTRLVSNRLLARGATRLRNMHDRKLFCRAIFVAAGLSGLGASAGELNWQHLSSS